MSLLRTSAATAALLSASPTIPAFEDGEDDGGKPTPTVSQTNLSPSTPKGKPVATSAIKTTKATTGEIRGSYVKLFKAELPKDAKPGDTPKFGITLLIPKTDTACLARLESSREAAIIAKWPAKRPAVINTTLHDGDLPNPSSGEPYGDECKGCMVMAVQSKFKPEIVDIQGNEIISEGEVGSGDYFKVSLNAYGYEFSGKKGVSFGLGNVLFLRKGVSLAGKTSAADDFADDLQPGG